MDVERHDLQRLVVIWYHRGWSDIDYGGRYSPPDNAYLRQAYALGWADWITGGFTEDEDVIREIVGCSTSS